MLSQVNMVIDQRFKAVEKKLPRHKVEKPADEDTRTHSFVDNMSANAADDVSVFFTYLLFYSYKSLLI